jgi:predicted HTH transcriptional regulator
MTDEEVYKIIVRLAKNPTELNTVEFKESNDDSQMIARNISALSNTARIEGVRKSYLIWGIQDETHELVGTNFNYNKWNFKGQNLELWLSNNVADLPNHKFYTIKVDDKNFVLLEIDAASNKPVSYEKNVYIRVGHSTTDIERSPGALQELWRKLNDEKFEEAIALENVDEDQILSLLDIDTFYNLIRKQKPMSNNLIISDLIDNKFIANSGSLSFNILNIGAILLAKNLDDFGRLYLRKLRIIKYIGNTKVTAEVENESSSGYAVNFDKNIKFIQNHIGQIEETGVFREIKYDYPEVVLRELMANALIHQDFQVEGATVLVEIYNNRIEFSNPGTPLIDTKKFIGSQSRSRNSNIAEKMRDMHLCEKRGAGWVRIAEAVEYYNLPAPRIRTTEFSTIVELYSTQNYSKISKVDRVNAVLMHAALRFAEHKTMTSASLRERFRMTDKSPSVATKYINEAIDEGVVVVLDPNSGTKNRQYIPFWGNANSL